jgi:DNA polymerase-3 subunit chi
VTQVDFYILTDQARDDRFGLACRLAEKAWQQGRRVLLHTGGTDEARHLDRLLWSYREQSFVPHGALGEADPALNPVLVGRPGQDPGEEHDVLINLASEVPTFFSRFDRVLECVDSDEAARQASRDRYRFYNEHGYPLQTHNIA